MAPGETALLCIHIRPINMEPMDVRDGRSEKVSQLLRSMQLPVNYLKLIKPNCLASY
jgi:hypothetical protein